MRFVCQAPAEKPDDIIAAEYKAVVITQDLAVQSAGPVAKGKPRKTLLAQKEADRHAERGVRVFQAHILQSRRALSFDCGFGHNGLEFSSVHFRVYGTTFFFVMRECNTMVAHRDRLRFCDSGLATRDLVCPQVCTA